MRDDPPEVLRRLRAEWDDADTLDALDELDATTRRAAEPPPRRTPEERAAERAARDDWKRAGATL